MAYKKFELEPIVRSHKKSISKKPQRPIETRGLSFKPIGNGKHIIPHLFIKPSPDKLKRSPCSSRCQEYEDGLTKRQLISANIKFLFANGFTVKEIIEKTGATQSKVYNTISGRTNSEILPVKPSWFEKE